MNDIRIKEEYSPYIFSFPHSGQMLTREMEFQLTPEAFQFLPNVDWHLEELYGFLKKYKVSVISTPHSRYVVDVNRPHDAEKFGNYRRSLVYSTSTWDEEIYVTPLSSEEIERRIKRYYNPYHEELEALITKKVQQFGKVYLIDIHSFMGPITEDVCLGNRNNTTSSKEFIERCYNAFESEGFNTVKNKVFIGGYITQRYAIKDVVETLQIELRYSNYIEAHELDVRKIPSLNSNLFDETSFRLEKVMEKIGVEKKDSNNKIPLVVENSSIWLKRMFILLFIVALVLAFFEGNIS